MKDAGPPERFIDILCFDDMIIREAIESDVAVILPMMERFNAFESIKTWTQANGEGPLRKLVTDRALGVVAVVLDPEPIGYFVLTWGFDLEWGGRDAILTELYLEAPARASKRGRKLVAEVERLARANGAGAIHLMVRPENEPAKRLYLACGFGVSPRLFMTKILA